MQIWGSLSTRNTIYRSGWTGSDYWHIQMRFAPWSLVCLTRYSLVRGNIVGRSFANFLSIWLGGEQETRHFYAAVTRTRKTGSGLGPEKGHKPPSLTSTCTIVVEAYNELFTYHQRQVIEPCAPFCTADQKPAKLWWSPFRGKWPNFKDGGL